MSDINFSKLTWENLPARTTALSATNLNRIEKGIDDSVNGVNSNSHSIAELQTRISQIANGSPAPVATIAEMTEHDKVYLYTGSETGYTAGNWYYYNGTAWTSGGVYGGAVTSTTFNQHGVPADDYATGQALAGKADSADVTALDTRVTEAEGVVDELSGEISNLDEGIGVLDGFFVIGALDKTIVYPSNKYTVCNPTIQQFDRDITLVIESGFKINVNYFDAQGERTAAYGNQTGQFIVPKNTRFNFSIRRNPEDTSEVITDKSEFVNAVMFSSKVNDRLTALEIDNAKNKDLFSGLTTGAKTESIEDVAMLSGQYQKDYHIGTPYPNNARVCYPLMFEVTDTDSFVFDSDGEYNIAFVAFDSDGVCTNSPSSWLSDGTLTPANIRSSSGNSNAAYYSFQMKTVAGGNITVPPNARTYCSMLKNVCIDSDAISDDSISESKLDPAVKQKLNAHGEESGYDVWMFMGQSNMAGRGITNESHPETAPTIISGAGYEFRAISDPTKLYPIAEPFGVAENKSGGINDGSMKTGSMVTAFANAYYKSGKRPIIAVSASKGGSTISQWQPNVENSLLDDALQRFSDCVDYLTENNIAIRHKYVLWCQGESDMDWHTSKSDYLAGFNTMLASLLNAGIEKLFMVRIGEMNTETTPNPYKNMIDWQIEIAQSNKNVVMASTDFASMRTRSMMKDDYHYYQDAYNEVGTYAGINCAVYANTLKEPTMYDPLYDELYYSHKN